LSEKALLLCIIDGLLEMLGTNSAKLPTFATDHRQPALVNRVGSDYVPSRRCS